MSGRSGVELGGRCLGFVSRSGRFLVNASNAYKEVGRGLETESVKLPRFAKAGEHLQQNKGATFRQDALTQNFLAQGKRQQTCFCGQFSTQNSNLMMSISFETVLQSCVLPSPKSAMLQLHLQMCSSGLHLQFA